MTTARRLSACVVALFAAASAASASDASFIELKRCADASHAEERFFAAVSSMLPRPATVECAPKDADAGLLSPSRFPAVTAACTNPSSPSVIFTDAHTALALQPCPGLTRVGAEFGATPLVFVTRPADPPKDAARLGYLRGPKPSNLLPRIAQQLFRDFNPTTLVDFSDVAALATALVRTKAINVAVLMDEPAHGSIARFAQAVEGLTNPTALYVPAPKSLPSLVTTLTTATVPGLQAQLSALSATPPERTLALTLGNGTITGSAPRTASTKGTGYLSALFLGALNSMFGVTSADAGAPAEIAYFPAVFATNGLAGADPAANTLLARLLPRAYVATLPELKTEACDDDTLYTVRTFVSAAYVSNTADSINRVGLHEQYQLNVQLHQRDDRWSIFEERALEEDVDPDTVLRSFLQTLVAADRSGNAAACRLADDPKLGFVHANDPPLLRYQDAALALIADARAQKGQVDQAKLAASAGCLLKALNAKNAPACSVFARGVWTDAYLPALRAAVIHSLQRP